MHTYYNDSMLFQTSNDFSWFFSLEQKKKNIPMIVNPDERITSAALGKANNLFKLLLNSEGND